MFEGVAETKAQRDPAEVLGNLKHRRWDYSSATQIETFEGCPRKWWLRYIGGLFETSDAGALGSAVHREIRSYLTEPAWSETDDALALRARTIVLAGVEHLPPRGSIPLSATEWHFALAADGWPVMLAGVIDLTELETLTDFKTSSDIRAKLRGLDLKTDIQGLIYALAWAGTYPEEGTKAFVELGPERDRRKHAIVNLSHIDPVDYRHIYFRTKDPMQSAPVTARLEVSDLEAGLVRIEDALHGMQTCSGFRSPREVIPNPSACYDGYPCAFIDLCSFMGTNPITKKAEKMAFENPYKKKDPAAQLAAMNAEAMATAAPALAQRAESFGEALAAIADEINVHARIESALDVLLSKLPRPLSNVEVLTAIAAVRHFAPPATAPAFTTMPRTLRELLLPMVQVSVPALESIAASLYGADLASTIPATALYPYADGAVDPPPVEPPPVSAKPGDPKIPDHPHIPVNWRGRRFAQVDLGIAGRCRNELAKVAIDLGHKNVNPTTPTTKLKELRLEISDLCSVITGDPPPWQPTHKERTADELPAALPPPPSSEEAAAPVLPPPEPTPPPAPVTTPAVEPPPVAGPAEVVRDSGVTTIAPPRHAGVTPEEVERFLYVDCAPRDGDFVDLVELLAPLMREVEADKKTPHYLVPAYSEGPRHVAALLFNRLQHNKITLPGRLVVMRSYPGMNECLADLLPRYPRSHVIEGRR